jgi:uncharacterized membrane protein
MSREATRSQRDWLGGEVAAWMGMGLVGPEQARTLLDLYESPEAFKARQRSRGELTLLALAATFAGLGVLLLVGYNWDQMPAALKVTAIFAALCGTHAAGFWLRYQLGWRQLSEAAFFLGCLFFGSALWLLAQIFHISSDNYDALWWWAIGVIPFALLLDTLLLHLLLAGLLALWVGFDILSLGRLMFWHVPDGCYSLPLLAAPGLWWAYRKRSPMAVGIYVALFAWWVVLQPIAWKLPANPTFFIGAIGSLMLIAAALHPPRSALAIPYRFYGVAIVGGTLVPLGFLQFNQEIDRMHELNPFGGVQQMTLIAILTVATLGVAYVLRILPRGDATGDSRPTIETPWEFVRRQAMPFGFLAMFAFLACYVPVTSEPWLPTIMANAAMIVLALALLRSGLTEDRGRPFAVGVAYLLFWAVLRYMDLFGAFGGMLGAALVFFLCGGAMLAVALYWRNRKAVTLV